MSWNPNQRTHRDIHVAMLEMVESEGKTPEEVRKIVLSILDDTMPELVELQIRRNDLNESIAERDGN